MHEEEYCSLLTRKKELMRELLSLSCNTADSGSSLEKSAEDYIGFVDAREKIIVKLKRLDDEQKKLGEPSRMAAGSALLCREITEIASMIAAREVELQKRSLDITARLRREINGINKSKKAISGEYTTGVRYQSKA